MAQQVLLKYINFRQTFSHLVCNADYLIPSVTELISNGSVHIKQQLLINHSHIVLTSEDINSGTDSGWTVAVANSVITVSELPSR